MTVKNRVRPQKDLTPVIDCVLLLNTVLLVELVNTSTSLSSFLLSCVERMTFRADFYMDIFLSRSCYKCVTAVTCYSSLIIIWMNTLSHYLHLSKNIIYCIACFMSEKDIHDTIYIPINSLVIVAHESVNCKTFL